MKNLKKLSKFLLAGAALSGALISKMSAVVDLDIATINKNYENEITKSLKQAIKKLKNEITSAHKINLDGFETNDEKETSDHMQRYTILASLKEFAKMPIIKYSLEVYNKEEKKNYSIKYIYDIDHEDPETTGETDENSITLYGKALENSEYEPLSQHRFEDMTDKLVAQIYSKKTPTQKQYAQVSCAMTLAHELGHFVSNIQEQLENKKKHHLFKTDETDYQEWLTNFYSEYIKNLYKNEETKKLNWRERTQRLLESKYGNQSKDDWFAEHFSDAIMKGSNMGESNFGKVFEKTLSELTQIPNCLTPSHDQKP